MEQVADNPAGGKPNAVSNYADAQIPMETALNLFWPKVMEEIRSIETVRVYLPTTPT